MNEATEERIQGLIEYFEGGRKPAVIAFSGGVDSSVLVYLALASHIEFSTITVVHQATPKSDIERVKMAGREWRFRPNFLEVDMHRIPHFTENPPDRCYYCKREMMRGIMEKAGEIYTNPLIIAGTNADDVEDGRPGIAALRELGIETPLADMGIHKNEVREMARFLHIPHDIPARPCYATRIPYGEQVSEQKIEVIAKAEAIVLKTGVRDCRVRFIEPATASIELPGYDASFPMKAVRERLKALGFERIVLSGKRLNRR